MVEKRPQLGMCKVPFTDEVQKEKDKALLNRVKYSFDRPTMRPLDKKELERVKDSLEEIFDEIDILETLGV